MRGGKAGGRMTSDIESVIGYTFRSAKWCMEALRHGSSRQVDGAVTSYERLEFLGDAVLKLVVADSIARSHPSSDEGELSKLLHSLVNNKTLADVGETLGLGRFLITDSSFRRKGGGITRKMLADSVEALIGAIHLDGGYEAAQEFVERVVLTKDRVEAPSRDFDPKTRLKEICDRRKDGMAAYEVVEVIGPDHARRYRVAVTMPDGMSTHGEGCSKKAAEMSAAAEILKQIDMEGET